MLYYDTDSVIYHWKEDQTKLEIGDYLEDLKDELSGDHITEFVSGGTKNYGYRTARDKVECKVRGFTLNVRGKETLNFDTMRKKDLELRDCQEDHIGGVERRKQQHIKTVLDQEEPAEAIVVRNPNHFHRDQTHKTMKLTGETRKKVSNSGLIFKKRV